MELWEARMQHSGADDALIVPADEPKDIISWLEGQSAETWHVIVSSWNYDSGDEVLRWILDQDRCDRGTAAQVFQVEGMAYWLGDVIADPSKAEEPSLLTFILERWPHLTGDLRVIQPASGNARKSLANRLPNGLVGRERIAEIFLYEGTRAARSDYAAQDGAIVLSFDAWVARNRIEIDR